MKYGIASILTSASGIAVLIWLHLEIAELFQMQIQKQYLEFNEPLFNLGTGFWTKLVFIFIALIGLRLGVITTRSQKIFGVLSIALSLILLLLSFIPIWTFIISDSALDVNFIR